ncbi:MAG: acylphosphatase [Gammaproteobacteria bacterium]|jgi:acylphosphatase
MTCRHYFVSGRVQGVFYRSSTQRQARSQGLTGWVRNRSDGRVEVLACGDEQQLSIFTKWLEIGPDLAKVTNIKVSEQKLSAAPASFDVLPTV